MVRDLLVQAGIAWSNDRASRLAAAFSFYSILSLSPLLVIGVTVLGLFLGGAENRILREATGYVGEQGAALLHQLIQNAQNASASTFATVLSLLLTFFSASNLFIQLQDATNSIWKIESKDTFIRSFFKTRLMGFFGVVVFGVLLSVWFVLDARISWLAKHAPGFELWQVVSILASTILLIGFFAVMFRVVPATDLEWRDVWLGAIVTALGFTASKSLLNQYFSRSAVSEPYGIAGAMVVILLWFYYAAQIYFFGVELTCAFARRHGSKAGESHAP
jgi:membrane protein